MTYTATLYFVFGQIPHPLVPVTKDGCMELLIKLLLIIAICKTRQNRQHVLAEVMYDCF
jgi:hypothetical protein